MLFYSHIMKCPGSREDKCSVLSLFWFREFECGDNSDEGMDNVLSISSCMSFLSCFSKLIFMMFEAIGSKL